MKSYQQTQYRIHLVNIWLHSLGKNVQYKSQQSLDSIRGEVRNDIGMTHDVAQLTSMLRIMTLFPWVYKKFFPLGSPPRTRGCPRWVLGNVANKASIQQNKSIKEKNNCFENKWEVDDPFYTCVKAWINRCNGTECKKLSTNVGINL